MKGRLVTTPDTDEDVAIWNRVAARFKPLEAALYMTTSYAMSDKSDADMMLMLAEVKPCLPGTKAVAHRLIAGQLADSLRINGLWVALA